MANRPRSIYERYSTSTLPPPDAVERTHLVLQGENIISIANAEYDLQEYSADLWRGILEANEIDDAALIDEEPENGGYRGKLIIIPAKPLPDFL